MNRSRHRPCCWTFAVGAALALAATPARAEEPRADLGAAGGDRAVAESLIQSLDRDRLRQEHREIVAEALGQARLAFERGTRFRVTADDKRAREADALARAWAETARDLVRASDAEAAAGAARRKAVEAEAQLERTRALVEEAIARIGRLHAEIARADRSSGRVAIEAHDGSGRAPKSTPARGAAKPPARPKLAPKEPAPTEPSPHESAP